VNALGQHDRRGEWLKFCFTDVFQSGAAGG
jgi:hypothetical protein